MSPGTGALLSELERIKADSSRGAANRKREILSVLERTRLGRPGDVARLHDALLFLRAYPDDQRLVELVVRILASFPARADLRHHRERLADTGIAGTTIRYRFYAETAAWLAKVHAANLTVDWPELDRSEQLEELLPLLATYAETPALDQLSFSVRQWVQRMKGPEETDAAFLIRRLQRLRMDSRARESVYDRLDIPMSLSSGPNTPSRTSAFFRTGKISFRTQHSSGARPELAREVPRPPVGIRVLSPASSSELVALARGMMVTQQRDLDVFSYADARDARLVEWGGGLSFGFVGAIPERRLLLESLYGYVILQNGVPIGYGTVASLYGSSEVAFNVSPAFRGGEAALVFARLLGSAKALFGSDSFTLDPYQIGQDNDEAIATGAWWFYQKLGFRATNRKVLALMDQELRRMRSRAGYRSPAAMLERLAVSNVFFHLGRNREDVLGAIPLENVGLRVMEHVARRYGSRREEAIKECSAEAQRLLDVRNLRSWSDGQRLAWDRWAPVVAVLAGVSRWPLPDRRRLAAVIRAKGGRRESDFVLAFDAHRRLRAALRELAR